MKQKFKKTRIYLDSWGCFCCPRRRRCVESSSSILLLLQTRMIKCGKVSGQIVLGIYKASDLLQISDSKSIET